MSDSPSAPKREPILRIRVDSPAVPEGADLVERHNEYLRIKDDIVAQLSANLGWLQEDQGGDIVVEASFESFQNRTPVKIVEEAMQTVKEQLLGRLHSAQVVMDQRAA